MAESRRYAAVAEVGFHLGELYFLMPFIASIDYAQGERICLLFTSRALHEQYLRDPLLVAAVERIGAEVVVVPIRKKRLRGPLQRLRVLAREPFRRIRRPFQRRRALDLLSRTDVFMVQVGGGLVEEILRPGDPVPQVVRFPHTSSAQIMDIEQARKQVFRQVPAGQPILLLDPEAEPYYRLYGVTSAVILGYHSLSERWLSLLRDLAPQRGDHAVVYSFSPRDDMLPRAKWEVLHRTTYLAIRDVFGDLPILVKPHPNQDAAQLAAFVAAEGWEGATVTTENPMLISLGARFSVGFLTGGIYNTMMLDIPSINYYNARDDYARSHGSFMQDLAAVGAADAKDEGEFRALLEAVSRGELRVDFGTRKRRIPMIASWAEFRERLASAT